MCIDDLKFFQRFKSTLSNIAQSPAKGNVWYLDYGYHSGYEDSHPLSRYH